MARVKPYKAVQIDSEICDKLATRMREKRYLGSFTSFVESILNDYGDRLLVDLNDKPTVAATRVRVVEDVSKGESHRKAS